ncbi:MAG: DNA polymerase I [Candidatus Sungbacteria bacterium]|nr:DNA polymerase I [Candidatus Sungbacteria bacterium]
MQRLVLLDTHAIIHRAYHALPPLTAPGGEPINAVYGFTSIVLRLLRELKPDYIAACFDLPGKTFRHESYAQYKANRPEAPQDLIRQFNRVREVLSAFRIMTFEQEGYEADDIIGTIAERFGKNHGVEIIVVTGDSDILQLVRSRVKVYAMRRGITDIAVWDERAVRERYGLKPEQLVGLRGLKGDPSDNIPGVKGIGEKTALDLMRKFGSLKNIYAALKKSKKSIAPSVAQKLADGKSDALMSADLARIRTDAPISPALDDMRWRDQGVADRMRPLFQALGFVSLLKRLEGGDVGVRGKSAAGDSEGSRRQASLLDAEDQAASIPAPASALALGAWIEAQRKKRIGLVLVSPERVVLISEKGEAMACSLALLSNSRARVFFSPDRRFVVFDGKAILRAFRRAGLDRIAISLDILLAGQLLGMGSGSYAELAARTLPAEKSVPDDKKKPFGRFFDIARELERRTAELGMEKVLYEIEMPLLPVLEAMEEQGIMLDTRFVNALGREADQALENLTKKIHGYAGEEFNINSPQQLSRILFDVLKIATHGLRKTEKGGVISTRESELEKIKKSHPIIPLILDYRELAKIKTTYIDVLPGLVNPATGRISTTFNQMGAATGRLSSSNPNLQNIPIISEFGRKIRHAFVAAPGYALASFDYSQIELRVAAHLAGDPKMIDAFLRGADIHALTASEVYNVPLDQVTPELRRAAKTLNFGVLYGMGARAFAQSTGLPLAEAERFIDEYFRDFSGIKKYIEDTKQFARDTGYVQTLFGRKRFIPDIHSPNVALRREAERAAINTGIQGTATGDIVKMAMVRVDEWIRHEGLGEKVRMLLQVHDELVFEIDEQTRERAAREIRYVMEHVVRLRVPLSVDVKIGKNWGEQKNV